MYHENFPETVSTSCRRSRVAVKITCLVSGDELKEDWVVPTCVYVFREKKTLITLFTKLKAYFKPVLQKIDKIHRLLYAIICSVHMY